MLFVMFSFDGALRPGFFVPWLFALSRVFFSKDERLHPAKTARTRVLGMMLSLLLMPPRRFMDLNSLFRLLLGLGFYRS